MYVEFLLMKNMFLEKKRIRCRINGKWGLDFVNPFKPTTAWTGNQYIIDTTSYCTKCVEAKALRDNTANSTTQFLYEHIWCHFSCLIELVSDQCTYFVNKVIHELSHFYTGVHKRSTPYYRQANRLAESTNKTIQHIPKKTVETNIEPIGIKNFIVRCGHIKRHTKRWSDQPHSEWRLG